MGDPEWTPIPRWSWYAVSRDGRVKRIKSDTHQGDRFVGRELKRQPAKGYEIVHLCSPDGRVKCFGVHRLVALAFIGDPPGEDMNVNHIDGDKLNNTPENLEWVTRSENRRHAIDTGLIPPRKLTEDDVVTIRDRYANGEANQYELAEEYGIHQVTVSEIVLRKIWSHV